MMKWGVVGPVLSHLSAFPTIIIVGLDPTISWRLTQLKDARLGGRA